MDSVRFGRVLGIGARLAGKTLAQAVDAAVAPNPRAPNAPPNAENVADKKITILPPATRASQQHRTRPRPVTPKAVAQGTRRFGEAMWGPVARASGVLWLEVTGVFFGLVAIFGAQGVWVHRAGILHPAGRKDLLLALALALVFGYFCVSSFLRASRKNRR